jgi:hypothetical protein
MVPGKIRAMCDDNTKVIDRVGWTSMTGPAVNGRTRSTALALAMAIGSPVAALLIIWMAVRTALRFAPGAVAAVTLGSYVVWIGSVFCTAVGVHRLVWQGRAPGVGPWAKGIVSLFATLVGMALFVKVLGTLVPSDFGTAAHLVTAAPERRESFARRLGRDPELNAFADRLRAAGQGDAIARIVAEKTASGLGRIDVSTRRRRTQLLQQILPAVGDEACAAMARGPVRGEDLSRALATLPPRDQEEWMEIQVQALKAELRQTPPPPPPSEKEIASVRAILSKRPLGDPQLQSVGPDAGAAYARKLCQVILDANGLILQMPEDLQSAALRMEFRFR